MTNDALFDTELISSSMWRIFLTRATEVPKKSDLTFYFSELNSHGSDVVPVISSGGGIAVLL